MSILIIIGAVITIFFICFLAYFSQNKSRKSEYKDWEIDDLIVVKPHILKNTYPHIEFLNGKKYAKIKGWDGDNVYLNFGDNLAHKMGWDIFHLNKSAIWRRNYKKCEKAMGKKPAFNFKCIDDDVTDKSEKINDKSIELMNETECQIYLKQAIEDENYELAERIRKQLEKFR